MTDKEKLGKLKKLTDAMYYAAQQLTTDASRLHKAMDEYHKFIINEYHKEETVSDLEEAATSFARKDSEGISNPANFYYTVADKARIFKAGAKWQKQQDQSTIELAEDHAYFAGRTKTIDEIKEALLSEVLPCFMHGGEADEVVAKLDEVLNQKK